MNKIKKLALLGLSILIIILLISVGIKYNDWRFGYRAISKLNEIELDYNPLDPIPPYFTGTHGGVEKHYNSQGLIGAREFTRENETRIAILGDSFLWGPYLNESSLTSYKLQQLLGLEVIDLSYPAYNTEMEVGRLKLKGLDYNPNIVLIFYLSNDIKNGYFDIVFHQEVNKAFGYWELDNQDEILKKVIGVYDKVLDFETGFYDNVEKPLKELAKLSNANKFEVVLLAFPSPHEHIVNLKRIADELSWRFVDLEKRGYRDSEEWSLWDGHPSEYANSKLAKFLADYLMSEQLVE